jgi:hypothetical protein
MLLLRRTSRRRIAVISRSIDAMEPLPPARPEASDPSSKASGLTSRTGGFPAVLSLSVPDLDLEARQGAVCESYRCEFVRASGGERIGVARGTLGLTPVNAPTSFPMRRIFCCHPYRTSWGSRRATSSSLLMNIWMSGTTRTFSRSDFTIAESSLTGARICVY